MFLQDVSCLVRLLACLRACFFFSAYVYVNFALDRGTTPCNLPILDCSYDHSIGLKQI